MPRVPVILPHHGSISKEVRLETEQALKRARRWMRCWRRSSLELGVDVGALGSGDPGGFAGECGEGSCSASWAMQGHLEKATAKRAIAGAGWGNCRSLGAIVPLMYGAGVVEETRVPENYLDVLARQIVKRACAVRPEMEARWGAVPRDAAGDAIPESDGEAG